MTLAVREETPACPASVFNSVRRASVAATVPKLTVIESLLPVPVRRKPSPTPCVRSKLLLWSVIEAVTPPSAEEINLFNCLISCVPFAPAATVIAALRLIFSPSV